MKHSTRTKLVCTLAAVSLVVLVAAVWLQADEKVIAAVLTAAGIFVPAAADVLSVEKRRRTPGVPAIVDDLVSAAIKSSSQEASPDSDARHTD